MAPDSPVTALSSGFRVLWRDRQQALVVACFVTQLLVRGLLSVLLVLVALEMFEIGDAGVGWLSALIGAGGVAGAAAAVGLAGRRRLAALMALGLVLWGAPIAVIGLAPVLAVALAALFVVGLGNSVLDVAGFTLLQRMGDDVTLARVFGAFFTVGVAISAGGAALAPALVGAFGLRAALVTTGAVLPVAALAALPRLRRIDASSEPPGEALAVLSGVPLLADLAPTTLEKLARRSQLVDAAAGEAVVAIGDEPDRFYVLVDGAAEVLGGGGVLNRLVPGDHFGEIALIGGGRRTATVRTTQPSRLLSIGAREFVDAVNGNASAFALTTGVIGARLANDRARTISNC